MVLLVDEPPGRACLETVRVSIPIGTSLPRSPGRRLAEVEGGETRPDWWKSSGRHG